MNNKDFQIKWEDFTEQEQQRIVHIIENLCKEFVAGHRSDEIWINRICTAHDMIINCLQRKMGV